MNDEATISRLEQLLEDSIELAEENNKLLRSLLRSNRIAFWAKALMWIIILILPFILLGPLVRTLVPAADTSKAGSVFGFPSPTEIQNIVNSYRASTTNK
ncbi:MAG: hypothetical protein JWN49_580 [Parcubacteria group bacterium]|nr:hypothetical protein [Parcubacteria group bacterium]